MSVVESATFCAPDPPAARNGRSCSRRGRHRGGLQGYGIGPGSRSKLARDEGASSMNPTTRAVTARIFHFPIARIKERSLAKPGLPPTRRAVSTALQARLRGESQVRAYYGDNEQNVVAIVEAEGSPHPALVTYMTASLHAVENWLDGRDVRVELMIVGPRGVPELGNVVATSAFNVSKDGWLAAPGVVFRLSPSRRRLPADSEHQARHVGGAVRPRRTDTSRSRRSRSGPSSAPRGADHGFRVGPATAPGVLRA